MVNLQIFWKMHLKKKIINGMPSHTHLLILGMNKSSYFFRVKLKRIKFELQTEPELDQT